MTQHNNHPTGNVYDEIGLPDSRGMARKAKAVSELIAMLTERKLSIDKAAVSLGLSSEEFREILKGQFHNTSLEVIIRYVKTINNIRV